MKTNLLNIIFGSTIIIIFIACLSDVLGVQNDIQVEEEINKLINYLNKLQYYQEPPEDVIRDTDKIRPYWALQRQKRDKARYERKRVKAELSNFSDKAVERIVVKIRAYPEVTRGAFYDVLKDIGTVKARKALLDVALGQNGFEGESFPAAVRYVKSLKNKDDVMPLLDAKNFNIVFTALKTLEGIKITQELFQRLKLILRSRDTTLAAQAGEVMIADKRTEFAKEKVSTLIDLIEKCDDLPKGKKRVNTVSASKTSENRKCIIYTNILYRIQKADDFLRKITGRVKSPKARRAVILARAHKGDLTVKDEIYKIAREEDNGVIRKIAILAYEYIGNSSDLPFLKEIMLNDPHVVVIRIEKVIDGMLSLDVPQEVYPVRKKAIRIIKIIEDRNKKNRRIKVKN